MKAADLIARGATVCGGGVDYKNKYLGRLMADGDVLLTLDGEAIAKALLDVSDAVIVKEVPHAKTKSRAKLQVNDDLDSLLD